MKLHFHCFSVVLISTIWIINVSSRVEFNNAKCSAIDESYVTFDVCQIKAVNRTYKYMTVIVTFPRQQQIYNISTTFALLRKASGYKPFLYNYTLNACKYLKKRTGIVARYFHSWFEKYSTLNKSCPYGQDPVIIDKLPISHINHLTSDILPLPAGDYALHTSWKFYSKMVAIFQLFFSVI